MSGDQRLRWPFPEQHSMDLVDDAQLGAFNASFSV